MYSTAEIFEPGSAARDNDLNGVYFADAPALVAPDQNAAALRSELAVYWPQRVDQLRLYGMGFDAYQLVGPLYDSTRATWPLHGMSGDLTLDINGRIDRSLPLAQIRNGRPVALDLPSPTPAGEDSSLVGSR
jgi:outer membrane PBP1 activator LpoA protein